jgi:predicted nucleotidyltransferase
MNQATRTLRSLADRVAAAYLAHTRPVAILLVGSIARGDADYFSDLDLILYYDESTSARALAAARRELGAERARAGEEAGCFGERYYLDAVQCQLQHETTNVIEGEIRKVVQELDLDDVLLKIMIGLTEGLPLHGAERIKEWRRRAAFTVPLQRAMIEKHWKFFPWWHFQERLGARDATIWRYDVLVESTYHLVGVLAALNRLYFSQFEFKRSGDFLRRFEVAPQHFGERLHALFELDEPESTPELERLVAETAALVAERFSDIDLSIEWGGNPTPPGSREVPWRELG